MLPKEKYLRSEVSDTLVTTCNALADYRMAEDKLSVAMMERDVAKVAWIIALEESADARITLNAYLRRDTYEKDTTEFDERGYSDYRKGNPKRSNKRNGPKGIF